MLVANLNKMADRFCMKKVGGKIIHSQAREIVTNLYAFMKREAEEGPILIKKVQERVAEATGISRRSVQRILKEKKDIESVGLEGQGFSTPRKKWRKRNKKSTLDDFDKTVVRRTVYDFHKSHNERPTLKTLLPAIKDKIDFKGGVWALRQVIRELGFRWKKSVDNRKILIEKHDIREKRVNFIRAVQQYRKEGRPIVYTDETYVHTTHTKPHSWSDSSNNGLLTPISKGNYAIIVHAGHENGFVNNALLIFKSGQKSGDYHDAMNFSNYRKWLEEKLIPNLPPRSVLVIDNASYHNKEVNPAPTSNTRKADMISWLAQNCIPYNEKMLKPELYQLIKLHKNRNKTYFIDSLLAEHGHTALRLPPYHPDLNPIEMIWALIKNHVALKNTTFALDDCIRLVREKIDNITKEDWAKRCSHARDVEEKYMLNEVATDEVMDRFVIHLGEQSSDSDWSQDSDSEDTLSGVEAL